MSTRSPRVQAVLFGLVGMLASAGIPQAQTPQAIQFDGVNDYVTFGIATSLGASTFTLEVQFKKTGTGLTTSTGTGGVTAVPLVTKGRGEADGSNVDCNYFLGINGSGQLVADYEEGAGQTSPGLNHPVTGTTVIQNNIWYHAAAVFDGTTWRLYLNGNLDATLVVGASRLPRSDSIQHAGLATAMTSNGTAAGFFQGILEEARIWNVVRTQLEIQNNMGVEVLEGAGLLGRWGLNEGSGTSAGNSIAGSPAGTLTNGPVWVTDSPIPLALAAGLRFDGTNGYVSFGDPDALDLAQFTVECWFRRDGAGVTTTTGSGGVTDAIPMVTHGASESDNSPVDMNFFLGIRNSDGVLCADFEEGATGASPGQNHPVVGVTPIPMGAWHHAAVSYDGATWNLYLDGSLEKTLAVGQPVRFNTVQLAALATSLTSTGTAKGFFNGALDEVRVWSVARGQAEIVAAMNSKIVGSVTNLAARWGLDEDLGVTVSSSAGTTIDGAMTGTGWSWTAGAPFDAAPPSVPADPTGLTATAASHVAINLNWVDVASNETSYDIERSASGGPFTSRATVAANSTSYADPGLNPSSEYCYRVRAMNAMGVSGYAGPACATTLAVSAAALDVAGNTYVSFGDAAPLRLTQFTLEMWIRRDGAGTGTNSGTGGIPDAIPLLAKGRAEAETAVADINYLFGIRASDGVLCADFEEGASGAAPSQNHPVAGSTQITFGVWHHVAATYDGTTWNLYLDGNLDATLTVGQPVAAACTVGVSLSSALNSGGVAAGFFDGAVDEVRIWDVPHTLSEIQARANAQIDTPEPGLVGRWGLDEATGTTVSGSAGTVVNGTITGSAYSWILPGAPFDLDFNRSPSIPVLVAPGNAATGVSTSPTLQVQASDPDGGDVTVTFYARPTGGAGPDFTLIGLPDTQYYSGELNGGTNAMFQSQTNWIVNNRASRNIGYAAQVGDCVEHGDNAGNDIEWQRADLSLGILENPLTTGFLEGIPYGMAVGNHDQSPNGDAAGTTTFYNQYFGVDRFAGRAYYGGHYGSNNDNWYQLWSASGMDFIVVSFEYDTTPDAAVLAWADDLLTAHSTRRAIVVSHSLVGTGNPASFSTQGQATYDALKGHSNLFLMLCGHVPGEGRRQDTFNGNTVHTLLADYQSRANGGSGWLRIMEFSPANNVIRVKTYSPWLNQYEADADSSSQFTLAYPMSSATPFSMIGIVTVPSGSTASVPWPNLSAFTGYEWYATVRDTSLTTTGPVWTFTTGVDNTPPAVQAVFPNGAETLTIGTQVSLQWSASDNTAVGPVDLFLARNGVGGSYETIATGIANSGIHDWTVTGPVTTNAFLKVVAHDPAGNVGEDMSDQAFNIAGGATGVREEAVRVLALSPVFPNPANRAAQFSFSLPKETPVRLSVLDIQGREVGVLTEGIYPPGVHAVAWDRKTRYGRVHGGVYFIRLQVSGQSLIRKVVLTD